MYIIGRTLAEVKVGWQNIAPGCAGAGEIALKINQIYELRSKPGDAPAEFETRDQG
jgi:hypothetical protein